MVNPKRQEIICNGLPTLSAGGVWLTVGGLSSGLDRDVSPLIR